MSKINYEIAYENVMIANKMLEQEIERLKEELKYTIPIVEHNQTIQSNINSYNKLAEYSEELEDRINKAIEYIEKSKLNPLNTYCKYLYVDYDTGEIEHLDELLDILKGSSDKE